MLHHQQIIQVYIVESEKLSHAFVHTVISQPNT